MTDAIKKALSELDPKNTRHWMEDGLPKVAVVAAKSGIPDLTREQINEVAPLFNRQSAESNLEPKVGEISPEPEVVAPEAKVLEVAKVDEVPSELTDLETAVAQADAKIADLVALITNAQLEKDRAVMARDALLTKQASLKNPQQNQLDIMHYLESQKNLRLARIARK
jgi:hypothetical protein